MCAAFRSHRKSATSSGSRSRPSARQFNRDVLTLDEAGYTCTAANSFEDRMNRRSLLGSSLLTIAALLKWPRSIGATLADDRSWIEAKVVAQEVDGSEIAYAPTGRLALFSEVKACRKNGQGNPLRNFPSTFSSREIASSPPTAPADVIGCGSSAQWQVSWDDGVCRGNTCKILAMHVGGIDDARQQLGRCARPHFSLRIRNRHDGRVRTRQRHTFKTVVLR